MLKIVKFLEGVLIHDRTFYRNEEIEYVEKFELYDTENNEWHWHYKLDIDSSDVFLVSDVTVMETNCWSNTGTEGESYHKKWGRKIQTDEAVKQMGKADYVEAGKTYLGVDISPHERSDKADYANQHLLPPEYRDR